MSAKNEEEKAAYLLRKLLLDTETAAKLGQYAWAREDLRRNELVYALLARVLSLEEEAIRDLVGYLSDLGHLEMARLARLPVAGDRIDPADEDAGRIATILNERGVMEDEAARALLLLAQLGKSLTEHFAGKVQRYLRHYGEAMLADVPRYFTFTGLSGEDVRYAFTYWLQEAASLPVSLNDASVQAFCREHGIAAEALWEAADRLDVNFAVVDDLIGLVQQKDLGTIKTQDQAS